MYILQEIQTSDGITALVPAMTYSDKNQAEASYHVILASAAVSSVNIHTVILYDEYGSVYRRESYEHPTESE